MNRIRLLRQPRQPNGREAHFRSSGRTLEELVRLRVDRLWKPVNFRMRRLGSWAHLPARQFPLEPRDHGGLDHRGSAGAI